MSDPGVHTIQTLVLSSQQCGLYHTKSGTTFAMQKDKKARALDARKAAGEDDIHSLFSFHVKRELERQP